MNSEWQKNDKQTKEIAFDTLLKAVTFQQAALRDILNAGVPSGPEKRKEANCVKMLAFLLAQTIEVQEVNKSRQTTLLDKAVSEPCELSHRVLDNLCVLVT